MNTEPSGPNAAETRPPVVILVEDDANVRTPLWRVLEIAGFTVAAFSHPEAALAAAGRLDHVDVLVTDVGLPDLTGSELAQRMRTLHPNVEALFMSGFATAEEFRDLFPDDEDRFLQKPFRPAEFVARVIHFSSRERLHALGRNATRAR